MQGCSSTSCSDYLLTQVMTEIFMHLRQNGGTCLTEATEKRTILLMNENLLYPPSVCRCVRTQSHWFDWAEWRIVRQEMYSTRVWKVYSISVRTRYCWMTSWHRPAKGSFIRYYYLANSLGGYMHSLSAF